MVTDPGNKTVTWTTNNEQVSGNGTDEKGTFERSNPQQNSKDTDTGDHTFYDPRNGRSGVAGGNRDE